MSSTIDTRRDGQVLVIFALTLVTLMLFAALAYDAGMMVLERRDQQNAADAAALAGARYLPGPPYDEAEDAARAIAEDNGFVDGINAAAVDVTFPTPNQIEVTIDAQRASIFGGIIGVPEWGVGSRALAINQDGVPAPFAMLSLEDVECDAIQVTGNGSVTANGNIQVNSACTDGALHRGGSGSITVTAEGAACNVVGDIKDPGNKIECEKNEGAQSLPDPLVGLAPPDPQGVPDPPLQEGGGTKAIPNACPGGASPATMAAPAACQFPSSYAETTWRLYPGDYPGGLKLQGGTFYLEPGIYYIAGGGLEITGNGSAATSVDGGTVLDFGVLIYNTEDADYTAECAAGTATVPADMCIQPIVLNGSDASIRLYPLNTGTPWDGIVIFSDRNLDAPGDDLQVNGSSNGSSDMEIRGTIYLPAGQVKVNGNEGTVTVDQIIADKFVVNGSDGSSIEILFDTDFIFGITAQGLIE